MGHTGGVKSSAYITKFCIVYSQILPFDQWSGFLKFLFYMLNFFLLGTVPLFCFVLFIYCNYMLPFLSQNVEGGYDLKSIMTKIHGTKGI